MDDRASSRAAHVLGQAEFRPPDLPRPRLSAELLDDLDGQGDTGRADRMALGFQTAAGVDREFPLERRQPFLDGLSAPSPLDDA